MSDWNPDDPTLAKTAPHELCGVMRMHRNGIASKEIMSMLRLRGTQLIKTLEVATEAENKAKESRRPIHDALITKEDS